MFLEICQIKKSFGTGDSRVEVLRGIQLSVEKGEFCVLLGPSGSGKSTLLNIISGIDRADEGANLRRLCERELPRVARRLNVFGGDYYELFIAVLELEAETLGIENKRILKDTELLSETEKIIT